MKISVRVKPAAKEESVEKLDDQHYFVQVKEPPVQGRANQAIVEVLARHFGVAPSRVAIVSGFYGRLKVVEVR